MSKQQLTIDVISDINCPWCYLGESRLKKAIGETNGRFNFELSFKPFELNPNAPPEGEDKESYFLRNYGPDALSRIADSNKRITEAGKAEGLTYNFDKLKKVHNSFNGHRLVWLAGMHNVQEQVLDALYRFNFSEGGDLNNTDDLERIGIECGIPAEALEGFFESDAGKDEVKAMELEAHQAGITGVPAFVLNNKYLISGAQPKETFLKAFEQLASSPE